MTRVLIALVVAVCVLGSGCLANSAPSTAPGSPTGETPTAGTPTGETPTAGTPTSDSAGGDVYTDRLKERLDEYETYNETGKIRVIVALENGTSDAEFNQSVREMNRTATVRYSFRQQRLIALAATPDQVAHIANMSSVKAISVDRQVTAEAASETPV